MQVNIERNQYFIFLESTEKKEYFNKSKVYQKFVSQPDSVISLGLKITQKNIYETFFDYSTTF